MKYEIFWGSVFILALCWAVHTSKQQAELTSLQTTCYPLLEENKNVR